MKNMKKIILLFLFVNFFVSFVTAQTVTKNTLPKNLKGIRMNLKIDFSDAMICGMSEEEFSKYEKDWEEDKPKIVSKFMTGANLGVGKSYKIGHYSNTSYIIMIKINTITDEGFIICDAKILDNEGNAQFIVESLTGGKEPPFMIGTKLARMKVWAALTGKTLGGILKRELSSRE